MLIKCQWSQTDGGARVACGGGDRTVTVWEVESGKILYKLGGHKGSVGAVDWHPREPISECTRITLFPIVSCLRVACALI
jgi:Prp8 binding protein